MKTSQLEALLDALLPDERVLRDLLDSLLADLDDASPIQIEFDEMMVIPRDAPLEIVTKAFFKEYHDRPWHTGYRAQVAIGGIDHEIQHRLAATYCFAILYYNADVRLITVDFNERAI